MPDLSSVLKDALTLDESERADLAQRLLASLDEEIGEAEAERLWLDEIRQRLEDYRAGRARSIPAHEVAEEVQKLLR